MLQSRGILGLGLAVLVGCGVQGPTMKETYPVTGQVFVDGSPVENLAVTCHLVGEIDKLNPSNSATFTGTDGKFAISTYNQGDGVPVGEYLLTFMWGELNVFSASYGGPDKLNDRYSDVGESKFKVHVEKGKPTNLGKIELTTK